MKAVAPSVCGATFHLWKSWLTLQPGGRFLSNQQERGNVI